MFKSWNYWRRSTIKTGKEGIGQFIDSLKFRGITNLGCEGHASINEGLGTFYLLCELNEDGISGE